MTYKEWLCAPYQENVTSVPSVFGVCTLTAPTQTGYNVKNSPTDPENTPRPINEIACTGGYTNINSVSVHWTDVSGGDSNIKYERQYKVNNGGWTGNEIYITHILVTDLLEEVLVIMVYMDHKLGHSMIQTEWTI